MYNESKQVVSARILLMNCGDAGSTFIPVVTLKTRWPADHVEILLVTDESRPGQTATKTSAISNQ